MRRRFGFVVLGLLLLALRPAAGRAQSAAESDIRAAYTVTAAGLTTARVEAELAFAPSAYRLRLDYRTAGLFGALFHSESSTLAQGLWQGDTAVPFHFAGSVLVRGEARQTVIDYRDGEPIVRVLVSPNSRERDPVPPGLERNTIDTLSAMALLLRRVQQTGRCEAHALTFDGRRLIDVSANTAGIEALPPADGLAFAGPALRCDFEGRQLAGFKHGEDAAALRRPKHGSAWLARVVPGAPPIPVRVSFETRWFGDATAWLTGVSFNRDVVGLGRRPGP